MASNLVTTVRNLRYRKARRRRQLAVLEGARLIEEALLSEVTVRGILATPEAGKTGPGGRVVALAVAGAVEIETVDQRTLEQLADTENPQGLIAVAEIAPVEVEAIGFHGGTPVLVLDGVQDPGNAGTMIRSAHALGSPGVILLPGTVDLLNPKVLRSSMGSVFRFPVAAATHEEFSSWCSSAGAEVWAGTTDGTDVATVSRVGKSIALAVGNEGAGLSEEIMKLVRQSLRIPISQGAESLNVGVAAGILLYELRQGASS